MSEAGGSEREPDGVRGLREAVRVSPDNVPLRQSLADALLAAALPAAAEREYRDALQMAPDRPGLLFGLARAFHAQSKINHALAVVESLTKMRGAPPGSFLLHARLLAGNGEIEQARIQYQRAVELDPGAAEAELAVRLGLDAQPDPVDPETADGRVRVPTGDGEDLAPVAEVERPRVNFNDVGGMEAIKDEIRIKIIHPMAHPEVYRAYGKSIGGGILLYGPPGCGKTHLARATAGEIQAGFISVGIHDVLDMWMGNSERNLHELFEAARSHRPCVLFFDEVDALGASRSDLRHHAGRQLINQFLSELDGVTSQNDGILVLAATNAPWHLDPAFRRPGRFDRILFVPPPDAGARAAVLAVHLRGKPVEPMDLEAVARKTDGFSGADLKAVVDLAIEAKLREALRSGTPKPLNQKDLLAAAAAVKPTAREWFSTARNYALYSNQSGLYDDILTYLKLK